MLSHSVQMGRSASALSVGLAVLLCAGISHADSPSVEGAPQVAAPILGGYDKGFFIQDAGGGFKLAIQARLQTRFAFENPEEGPGEGTFSIARARLTFKGHAFDPRTKYKFQSDFGKGKVSLKDFYVDLGVISEHAIVRVGQWKLPFSRQLINSSSSLELVDRAITDKAFGGGRDIGLSVHNNYEKSPRFEYALGFFNGTGIKSRLSGDVLVDMSTGTGEIVDGGFDNVPEIFNPTLVLRLGYNHGGIKGYKEGDLKGGPLRFGVGVGALSDFDVDDDGITTRRALADTILKVHGFAAMAAVFFDTEQSDLPETSGQNKTGFHLETSYMLGDVVQPVLQYALVQPDGDDDDVQAFTAGLSFYFNQHKIKWQTDFTSTLSEVEGGEVNDLRVRSQLQFAF